MFLFWTEHPKRIQGRIGENAVVEISSKHRKRGKSEIARDGRGGWERDDPWTIRSVSAMRQIAHYIQ